MLWRKYKYVVEIKGGQGRKTTEEMHGLIQHLIVIPADDRMVWSMKILDKESDAILDVRDHHGRLDDRQGIPVGADTQQKVTIVFDGVTENKKMVVILRVREVV
jgi:hypothetical protein